MKDVLYYWEGKGQTNGLEILNQTEPDEPIKPEHIIKTIWRNTGNKQAVNPLRYGFDQRFGADFNNNLKAIRCRVGVSDQPPSITKIQNNQQPVGKQPQSV